jgi:hypothetical protein
MNNPPAFPTDPMAGNERNQGMTLRDYFAAAALTGLCTSHHNCEQMLAEWSYRQADAMLAAREKTL